MEAVYLEERYKRSKSLMAAARQDIPGGVSSNIRQFRLVDTPPIVVTSGSGCVVLDADNNRYFDFVGGLGPLISGHGHPAVVKVISRQARSGVLFATPCELEMDLASLMKTAIPFLESVRFVASGTEAVMTAVRLARAFTGRRLILKFAGSYHGHADAMVSHVRKGGYDDTRSNKPDVMVARYNSVDSVRSIFLEHAADIAAVVIEPVASNMGVIPPEESFLRSCAEITRENGALLIADEVVSAFRYGFGSVSQQFGLRPDLITMGKVIGGGVSIGAYGGRADIMDLLVKPDGVFQGGTYAANPLAMAAGLAQLSLLNKGDPYKHLNEMGNLLKETLIQGFRARGIPYHAQHFGSLVTPILIENKKRMLDFDDVTQQDKNLFAQVHSILASDGFLLAPSIESPVFISLAHDQTIVERLGIRFVEAVAQVFGNVR